MIELRDVNPTLCKMTDEEYFSEYNRWMTAHNMAKWDEDPDKFWTELDNPQKWTKSETMVLGSAVHAWVLEGRKEFDSRYSIAPDQYINKKTGKMWGRTTKTFGNLVEDTSIDPDFMLCPSSIVPIMKMSENCHSHKLAGPLFEEGQPELCGRFDIGGVPFQGKFDWINPESGYFVDLKTTASLAGFSESFDKFNYNRQMALYRRIFKSCVGFDPKVYVVAVQKTEPWPVACYEVQPATLSAGDMWLNQKIPSFRRALEEIESNGGKYTPTWETRLGGL